MGPSSATKETDSRKACFAAANAAEAKKSVSTVVLDVRQVTVMADYFVIAGGDSTTQVRAIVDNIDEELTKLGYRQRHIEGKADGRWVLLDYGDIIVHVLHEKERNYYKLEQFWNNGLIVPKVEWERQDWVQEK
ncbi:MAG TPA: ribosome silencing factor [Drouetiella sp.]